MKELIVMFMTLLLLFGCSQKKTEVVSVENNESNISHEQVTVDFVPEHIKLSHIEVVEH